MRKKNTVITIASLLVITLFIGTAMPSVFAGSITSEGAEQDVVEEGCSLCASESEPSPDVPSCETCEEAVDYAVDYMKDYVKDNINGSYLLWRVDVAILICDGLVKGFKESGYKLEIDEKELKEHIEYWINKTVGPQMFRATLFLAKLGAIVIGITGHGSCHVFTSGCGYYIC